MKNKKEPLKTLADFEALPQEYPGQAKQQYLAYLENEKRKEEWRQFERDCKTTKVVALATILFNVLRLLQLF